MKPDEIQKRKKALKAVSALKEALLVIDIEYDTRALRRSIVEPIVNEVVAQTLSEMEEE